MKKLIWFSLLMIASSASFGATQILNFDPTIEGQTTLTIECTDPVERINGDALAVGEIVNRKFYVDANETGFIDTLADNTTECKQVFDMTKVTDGTYIYAVTALDGEKRESAFSVKTITAIVKRLPNPNSPSAVTATRS